MKSKKESQNGKLPIREVAMEVGVDLQTLSRWVKAGKIPQPYRDRNKHRSFSREQIEQIKAFYSLEYPPASEPQAERIAEH